MEPTTIELIATILFALAVCHTFVANKIEAFGHRFDENSMMHKLFHYLSEVEVVFGLWSLIFIIAYSCVEGFVIHDAHHHVTGGALKYLLNTNYTEPAFVFVIMCMAATRPVIILATKLITLVSKLFFFVPQKMAFYLSALIVGPLLGSFITEPAAMTVTALILLEKYYDKGMSTKFMYATIGLLFVNISVGGTLTHFAAPPVLMVAGKFHWGTDFMLSNFGYKAAVSIVISTVLTALVFAKELKGKISVDSGNDELPAPKCWMYVVHLLSLALVVFTAHYMVFFLGLFLFFLGFIHITSAYQTKLKMKESLLVGFFLAGLVTLGGQQAWWLQSALASMGDFVLFIGTTMLTGITDNAALTYLGSLVDLSDSAKYNLVAGAVAGGGLTVIANAPNPAGFGILKKSFGKEGINPLYLLASAIIPTIIVCIAFQVLPALFHVVH